MHLLVRDGDRVLAAERRAAAHHLVHDDAERVEVAAGIGDGALRLLGREVGGGPHHRAGLGEPGVRAGVGDAGDAEVGHLHVARLRHEDVAGLHVAVHDAVAMGEAERGGDLGGHVRRPGGGQLLLGPQDVGQGPAVHVLHHDEVRAALLPPVVDGDDVGVGQVGGGLRLPAEAGHEAGVGGELGEEHLDRHPPLQQTVARQVDVGHAAATETGLDLVAVVEDRGVTQRHGE